MPLDSLHVKRELAELSATLASTLSGDAPLTSLDTLKRLQVLAESCEPADAASLFALIAATEPKDKRHVGILIACKGNTEQIDLYLRILKILKDKGVSSEEIVNHLEQKTSTAELNVGLLLAMRKNATEKYLINLYDFFALSYPYTESDGIRISDKDLLKYCSQRPKSTTIVQVNTIAQYLATANAKAGLWYIERLIAMVSEPGIFPELLAEISEQLQHLNEHGDHLGTILICEHTTFHERTQRYLDLLNLLHNKTVLSDAQLLKILLIPNNCGVCLFGHLIFRQPNNTLAIEQMLALLEKLARTLGSGPIQAFLDPQEKTTAAEAEGYHFSFAEVLELNLKNNTELLVCLIRNDFLSDTSLKMLTPLHESIADELITQSKALPHKQAILLLQEAVDTTGRKPLARYFQLAKPPTSFLGIFGAAQLNSVSKIEAEIARRSRLEEARITALSSAFKVPALGSLN